MNIVKNAEDFYQLEGTNNVIIRMPFAEEKSYIALCTDPVKNTVIHFEWEGDFGFFSEEHARLLVNANKARYVEEQDLNQLKEYIEHQS